MKVIQFIYRPAPTHLGQSGTHDSYIYIGKDVNDLFERYFFSTKKNGAIEFIDTSDGKVINLNLQVGRETRLVNLGYYTRKHGINVGDDIILEYIEPYPGSEPMLYINAVNKNAVVFFHGTNDGCEVLSNNPNFQYPNNSDTLRYTVQYKGVEARLGISDAGVSKKRSDAKVETHWYRVLINNTPISQDHYIYQYRNLWILSPYNRYECHTCISR